MTSAQRLILVLLALAVLATFGVFGWLVFGRPPAQPAPTRTPAASTPTPLPTGAPTLIPTATAPATPAEAVIPPPTKPAPTRLAPATAPDWMGVGDFDGDARPDLILVNSQEEVVSILPGSGQGWNGLASDFPRLLRRRLPGRPTTFHIADLDADGAADLMVGLAGGSAEQGILTLWGRAPWPAQLLVLPQTPLALVTDVAAGQHTLYALTERGFQPIAVRGRQMSLLPFAAAPVRAEGSARAGAVWLTAPDGTAVICFVAQPAGEGIALATYRPAAAPAESIAVRARIDAVPQALLPSPAGNAELWLWGGERVLRGRLGEAAGGVPLAWEDELALAQPPAAVWAARLGAEQMPGVLTLARGQTSVIWQPWAAAGTSGQVWQPAVAGGVIVALTIGDADGDGRDDLVMAVSDPAGEVYLVTWTAATHPL